MLQVRRRFFIRSLTEKSLQIASECHLSVVQITPERRLKPLVLFGIRL